MTSEKHNATDDRVRPLLLAQAHHRHAKDWNYQDVEPVIATLLAERDEAKDGEKTARDLMQKAYDVNRKIIAESINTQDALVTAQAEIARLTASNDAWQSMTEAWRNKFFDANKALATAMEAGMREAVEIIKAHAAARSDNNDVAMWFIHSIKAAITKGATTHHGGATGGGTGC